jgi:hypothetical protein
MHSLREAPKTRNAAKNGYQILENFAREINTICAITGRRSRASLGRLSRLCAGKAGFRRPKTLPRNNLTFTHLLTHSAVVVTFPHTDGTNHKRKYTLLQNNRSKKPTHRKCQLHNNAVVAFPPRGRPQTGK